MEKLVIVLILSAFAVNIAFAETVSVTSDDEYQNLHQLKRKLIRMKREMDSFMGDMLATYPDTVTGLADGLGADIKVDVTETDKNILVKADLPGMAKDKIEITLDQGKMLKIAGSRDAKKEEASPGMVKTERVYGKMERILELPAECIGDGIKATYDNGVLDIVIPKKTQTKKEPVKIAVI